MTAFDTLARYEAKWALPACVSRDPMYANNVGKLDGANEWVATAELLLEAHNTLDQLHGDTYCRDTYEAKELRRIYFAAMSNVMDEIEAVRDAAIYDARVGAQDDDPGQECADEFNDWLSDNVTTVQAALNAARSSTLENRP